MSAATDPLTTTAHFLEPSSLYQTQKPYSLRFDPPPGFPRKNTQLKEHQIRVRDVRPQRKNRTGDGPNEESESDEVVKGCTWAEHGCEILELKSGVQYEGFGDEEWIKRVYLKEVANVLKDFLRAQKVQIFEHRVCSLAQ